MNEVKCVVAMYPNFWAKAHTIAEADKQAKRFGYRAPDAAHRKPLKGKPRAVYFFCSAKPEQVTVRDMGLGIVVEGPEGSTILKLTENW